MDFAAGLKLGDWKGSPPVLWAKGKLDSYGISTLDAATAEAWNLLPDTAFADVVIPALPGHVTFNTSTANATGNSTMHVRASGSAPELLSISGVVSIEDVNATLDIPEYDPSSSLIPESYTLTFDAKAVLGGDGGFEVSMGGTIEQDEETGLSAVLYASHGGGWSPLAGSLADWFYTPEFEGHVSLKINGTYFSGDFFVGYNKSLTLIPGLVEFQAYNPPNATGSLAACHRPNATGPYLCVEVLQARLLPPRRLSLLGGCNV